MSLSMTEEQRWDSATLKVLLINFFNSISLLGFSKIAHTCVLRPIERSHHFHTTMYSKKDYIALVDCRDMQIAFNFNKKISKFQYQTLL